MDEDEPLYKKTTAKMKGRLGHYQLVEEEHRSSRGGERRKSNGGEAVATTKTNT